MVACRGYRIGLLKNSGKTITVRNTAQRRRSKVVPLFGNEVVDTNELLEKVA